ncbi:MAG: metal-dependent transcriptional regulator [Planctomycetota bacterium]|nr:metal-dependent transcriptional regulator [Planctomycetota bacterium]
MYGHSETQLPTSTVENYLKQLYLEQSATNADLVSMGRLANVMGVVPGTATSMVKALSDSGLVTYEPRGGVRLTPSGQQLALHVLRRHRLIELFLVKVLGLNWSEVHEEADQLEHAVSDRVLDGIDTLLGHPEVDPHGDPIPTARGDVKEPPRQSLQDCEIGSPQRITRIVDQRPDFLRFVERSGLKPGATIRVQGREAAGDAVTVRVSDARTIALGSTAASKILVEPTEARGPC